jgi:hypothetical protein
VTGWLSLPAPGAGLATTDLCPDAISDGGYGIQPQEKLDNTMTSSAEILSHEEILLAARIIDGCRHERRVAWPVHGAVSTLIKGTMRHLTDEIGDGAPARSGRDIREQFVRITATWEAREHWLSVPDIMRLMREGLFIFRSY